MIRLVKGLLWGVYGVYCWLTFLVLACLALVILLLLPGLERRRRLAGWTARVALGAMGVRISMQRSELLPPDHCVVVANHTSYLDGVVLIAALPPRFAFV